MDMTGEVFMEKKRFPLLDSIRGTVLISMILYHVTWNFVYIYGMEWSWYRSKAAYLWQQSICWTFILLSGFCFSMGKRHIKNGSMVFGAGVLVTLATLIAMPQNRVVFGVLTCIGSCILLVAVMEKNMRKVPATVGMVCSFCLFLVTKNINAGYIGLGKNLFISLPKGWYANYVSTYFGFPFPEFYSTDYFSVFPWIFLFLTGFYLWGVFEKRKWWNSSLLQIKIPFVNFLGRHSLLIYLLHQPIIYALQELFL